MANTHKPPPPPEHFKESPLKKYLKVPEGILRRKDKKAQEKIPRALTSEDYIKLIEMKETKKREAEEAKQKRKEEREAKRLKKDTQGKTKSKGKGKGKSNRESSSDSEDLEESFEPLDSDTEERPNEDPDACAKCGSRKGQARQWIGCGCMSKVVP